MEDALTTDNQQKISAFSRRFYTLRAMALLKELITIVNDFDNSQKNRKILSKSVANKSDPTYLSTPLLAHIHKLNQRAKHQAEKLLAQLNDEDRQYPPPPTELEQAYIDRLTLLPNENNPEKRAEIERLLNQYASDLAETPQIYHTRLTFAYEPSLSSPALSPAFNHNIDKLRKSGIINPLNEATLLYNHPFDIRELLTFDDYRLYLLYYYFGVLRRGLASDLADTNRAKHVLTPFDLLFNPQLTITYSPRVLAMLHFRHHQQLRALTDFIGDIKEQARQLLQESGELIYHIEARIQALNTTLNQLKARQKTIDDAVNAQMQALKNPQRYAAPRQSTPLERDKEKVQKEIDALKRQRAFITNNTKLLGDYERISKLYSEAEKQFLRDLASYLLANKTDPTNTAAINHLREQILNQDLTINENHHQFRLTEKTTDPRFREKPFQSQNNQYTNYRKLWIDIIDSLFKSLPS